MTFAHRALIMVTFKYTPYRGQFQVLVEFLWKTELGRKEDYLFLPWPWIGFQNLICLARSFYVPNFSLVGLGSTPGLLDSWTSPLGACFSYRCGGKEKFQRIFKLWESCTTFSYAWFQLDRALCSPKFNLAIY